MKSRHNQYVSTPDWFTSQPKTVETIKTAPITTQTVMMGGGSGGVGSIQLNNKAISKEKELKLNDLTIEGYAILITELQPDPTNPDAVLPKPGEMVAASQWSSSNYIEVVEGSVLTINASYDSLNRYGVAFYDLTHRFISGITTNGTEQIVNVPAKTRYFRVCCIKPYDEFKTSYVYPGSYTVDLLNDIYNGGLDPFTKLKYDYETIHTFNADLDTLSFVVDSPLKLEIDSKNNIHLNMNDLAATGQFVTTTEEQQQVEGIKTFDNGIGIGDYLLVPDRLNNAIKLVHRSEVFPMEDDPETEVDESIPTQFGNFYTSGWLSALGVSKGDGTQEPRQALYELDDVLRNVTGNGVLGAEQGSVLTFDGSHWYATKIEHPKGMQEDDVLDILKVHQYVTETFLKENEYLTRPVADTRYLLIDMFRKVFTLLDPNGVEITDFTNLDSEISEVRVNYSLWSTGFVSALGKQNELSSTGTALYQLDDVLSNGSLVQGATNGSVLMFDGSHWYGGTIEIPEVITMADVQKHLDTLDYLRLEEAHNLFLTQDEGDERYLLRSQFEKIFTSYIGDTKTNSSDPNSSIDNIKVNYGFWSDGFISALGKSGSSSSSMSGALYELDDVLADGNEVEGASRGSVLMYNGSHWYADTIDIPDVITMADVQDHLDTKGYLVRTEAHELFLDEGEAKDLFYTKTELDDRFDLYYTKEESDERFLTLDQFNTIFTAFNSRGNSFDITNTNSSSIDNIRVNYGFWSTSFLSAEGKQVDSAIDYLDYIDVDEETISKKNGYLEFIGDVGGGGLESVTIKLGSTSYLNTGTTDALISLPAYPSTTADITESGNLYFTNARAQAAITGGASTIVTSDLTTSRALISNSNGKVAVSAVTSTELGYLDGVTSAIQTQLNGKLSTTGTAAAASKLTTSNGSATNPVYFSEGVPVACTYSLSATVNSGSAGRLAYYSGARAIDDYSSTLGGSATPIYLSSGTPTECSYSFTDYLPLTGGTIGGNLKVGDGDTGGTLTVYGTGTYGINATIQFGDSSSEVSIQHNADKDITIHASGTVYLDGYTNVTDDLLVDGGITMYSDIRKKTKLQDVELSLDQIANAPLIEHYYNSDKDKINHVSTIAQYWADMNDWFCKTDSEGYYIMEIQNLALASAISVARELQKFESETDRRIRELEEELETLKRNKYDSRMGQC